VLRVAGFFVLSWFLFAVLARTPLLGPLLARTGVLGFIGCTVVLAASSAWLAERALRAQRVGAEIRRLVAVDRPRNHGKIGALLLSNGRARAALEHLERAVAGEPEVAEWHYRRGCALGRIGRGGEARESFERALALDPEYAYGAARMQSAVLLARAGEIDAALAQLARFERDHGANCESACRRGLLLKSSARLGEARAAFDEAVGLERLAPRYQSGAARRWALRARLARLS
jgi:tetratricopeptide (TPR) repeat protein